MMAKYGPFEQLINSRWAKDEKFSNFDEVVTNTGLIDVDIRPMGRRGIVALGFQWRYGSKKVNELMARCGFPELYPRNVLDLTLTYALDHCASGDDYDAVESFHSWQTLYAKAEAQCTPTTVPIEKSYKVGGRAGYTFGDIKRFHDTHLPKQGNVTSFSPHTEEAQRDTVFIKNEYANVDTPEKLLQLVGINAQKMTRGRETARRYFIRYLYYYLNQQIKNNEAAPPSDLFMKSSLKTNEPENYALRLSGIIRRMDTYFDKRILQKTGAISSMSSAQEITPNKCMVRFFARLPDAEEFELLDHLNSSVSVGKVMRKPRWITLHGERYAVEQWYTDSMLTNPTNSEDKIDSNMCFYGECKELPYSHYDNENREKNLRDYLNAIITGTADATRDIMSAFLLFVNGTVNLENEKTQRFDTENMSYVLQRCFGVGLSPTRTIDKLTIEVLGEQNLYWDWNEKPKRKDTNLYDSPSDLKEKAYAEYMMAASTLDIFLLGRIQGKTDQELLEVQIEGPPPKAET
jgi:hypothetical protein